MGRKNDALRVAAAQFRKYQQLHLEKGTEDGLQKAETNGNMADLLEIALRLPGDFAIGSDVWPGLAKVAEEMSELSVNLNKLIGLGGEHSVHWDGRNLPAEIQLELGDLLGAIDFFIEENSRFLEVRQIMDRRSDKRATFRKWHRKPTEAPDAKEVDESVEFTIRHLIKDPSRPHRVTALWSDGYENSIDLRNYPSEDIETVRARLQNLRIKGHP